MTFVRTPATPRKPFGSALSSLGPPFPPFGLPANQESFHFYLGSSTFWEPAKQGASGDFAEDVKATPLRIWGGSVVDVLIISLAVIGQRVWRYLGARGRKGRPPGGQHRASCSSSRGVVSVRAYCLFHFTSPARTTSCFRF